MGGESASKALYMFAHIVSPPKGGHFTMCRIATTDGWSWQVRSLCPLVRDRPRSAGRAQLEELRALGAERQVRMRLEFAEEPAECDVGIRRGVLIGKEQDQMLRQKRSNRVRFLRPAFSRRSRESPHRATP